MTSRQVLRYFSSFCMIAVIGLFAAGCAIQDPPAFGQLNSAHNALAGAKKAGADKTFPDEYAKLEKDYGMARGTLYACQDAKAGEMALALIQDANALAIKKPMMEPVAKPQPINNNPIAGLEGPTSGTMNQLLTFDASSSSDADEKDELSYKWDFGDGTTSDFTFPIATHRYKEAGMYTVNLMVDDGKGGQGTAQQQVMVQAAAPSSVTVYFNLNSADLSDAAKQELAAVIQALQDNPSLTAAVTGYTDKSGSKELNMALSQRRAEEVGTYLANNGIAADRLTLTGQGEENSIGDNDTKAGRLQNRRVEVAW